MSMLEKINEKFLDARIKICAQCGNEKVELYEHGMSCESCGTSLYYGLVAET